MLNLDKIFHLSTRGAYKNSNLIAKNNGCEPYGIDGRTAPRFTAGGA